ncbi:hypothetical protein PHSC3_001373 [Chlamydiales bacterium STE3]|nr:hypothetical protein PHSC3_001373 [Chlamydiales bacterium STE3]
MSVNSSTALIPYIKPMDPMEFVKAEVEKGLSSRTRSIEQATPCPISSSSLAALNLMNLNLISLSTSLEKISSKLRTSLSSGGIKNTPHGRMISHRLFSPIGSMGGLGSFGFIKSFEFTKNSREHTDILEFGGTHFPIRMYGSAREVSSTFASSSKKFNGGEIAETLIAEASFTVGTDKKPIVATYGCGPCVALGGYEPTNKIAFMVHFSNAREVRESEGLIFYNITKLMKKKITSPIQLHLRGGIKSHSEPTIEAIKIWMRLRKDLPMEIVSEDILDKRGLFGGKSLSIDSRNGAISEYNPLDNPQTRGMRDSDAMAAMISLFIPQIKLAYSPQ